MSFLLKRIWKVGFVLLVSSPVLNHLFCFSLSLLSPDLKNLVQVCLLIFVFLFISSLVVLSLSLFLNPLSLLSLSMYPCCGFFYVSLQQQIEVATASAQVKVEKGQKIDPFLSAEKAKKDSSIFDVLEDDIGAAEEEPPNLREPADSPVPSSALSPASTEKKDEKDDELTQLLNSMQTLNLNDSLDDSDEVEHIHASLYSQLLSSSTAGTATATPSHAASLSASNPTAFDSSPLPPSFAAAAAAAVSSSSFPSSSSSLEDSLRRIVDSLPPESPISETSLGDISELTLKEADLFICDDDAEEEKGAAVAVPHPHTEAKAEMTERTDHAPSSSSSVVSPPFFFEPPLFLSP